MTPTILPNHERSGDSSVKSGGLHLLARILIGQIFFVAGIRKMLAFAGTAGYFSKLGLPVPEFTTGLVIVIELGGSLALLFAFRLREAAFGLAVFTIAAGFIGHAFWTVDTAQFSTQLNHFMKNVSIAGGLLLLALYDQEKRRQQ